MHMCAYKLYTYTLRFIGICTCMCVSSVCSAHAYAIRMYAGMCIIYVHIIDSRTAIDVRIVIDVESHIGIHVYI